MIDYRAKPGTLHMIGEVQHGQPWYHEADLPIDNMLSPKYFAAWRHELKPGDTVRLVRLRNGRVTELAEIMVLQVHDEHIEHTLYRPVRKFPVPPASKPEPGPAPERFVENDKYTVRNRGNAGWEVNDPDGNRVAKGLTEDEAHAIRSGSLPLPSAA